MSEPATVKTQPLRKTKAQLVEEVKSLRLRVAELEDAGAPHESRGRAIRESEESKDSGFGAIAADVTERKHAEARRTLASARAEVSVDGDLREQNFDELIGMFAHAPIGLCCFDRDLRFIFINDYLAALNGISVEEHQGRSIREIIPDVATGVEEQLRQVFETGESIIGGTVDAETPAHPGRIRSFQHHYYAIKSEAGTVSRVACVVQEVTARKRAEEVLRESEQRFRLLTDALPALISYVDSGECYRLNNTAYEHWFGHTREQLYGRYVKDVLGEAAYDTIKPHINTALSGETVTYESLLPYKHGGHRFVRASYVPHVLESGQVGGFFVLVEDITEPKRLEEALRQSEARLRSIMDHTPAEIFLIDTDRRYVLVNREFERRYNLTEEEVKGKTIHDFFPADIADEFSAQDREVLETAKATVKEQQIEYGGALHTDLEVKFPIVDSTGAVAGIGGIATDITKLKRAEIALQEAHDELESRVDARTKELHDANQGLRESGERLQRLTESTMAVPWEADARTWQFTYIGPQAEKLLGYPCERWLESDFWPEHIHPEDREYTIDYCLNSSKELDDYEFDYRMIASDGRSVWFHDIVKVVRHNGEPSILTGFMIDITARKRVEEELQDLTARLINAQEEERKRIARELHDDFNQRLALVTMDIEQLTRERAGSPEDFDGHIRDLLGRVKELSLDVHRLSHRLHPATLDHLGLVTAVKSLCQEMSALHDFRIHFTGRKISDVVPKEVALCCYRIVQEALRNVVAHSGARQAHVELARTIHGLELHVRDPGTGFDVAEDGSWGGLGLISMRERVRLVGGQIAITSSAAHGTEIDVLIPLSAADAV